MTDEESRQAQTALIAAQIRKMEFDMDHARDQARWDLRKFIITTAVSLLVALAAAVGAGVGLGNLIWAHREPPPVAAPFVFPPGTVITIPPAKP